MESDVGSCAQILPVASHAHRLVAECGEGREATKKTNERERAKLGLEQLAGVCEARKSSDEGTAQEIDGESSIGKRRHGKLSVHAAAECVAKERAGEAAGAYEKRIQKNRLQFHPFDSGRPTGRSLSSGHEDLQ